MSEPEATRDQLMREAAAWFARMRGPEAESSREAFEAWLRRGALHRGAYNRAAEIFAMGKLLAEDAPDPKRPATRRPLRWAQAGALLALAALCVIAIALLVPGRGPAGIDEQASPGPVAMRLLTSGNEGRTVRLDDGSAVELAADTSLKVRLGSRERVLGLLRGQARFDVFHDPRPFIVSAGGGRVIARGTLFDVALLPDRQVTVRLIEGVIDVDVPATVAGAPAAGPRRLRPGETLSFPATSGRWGEPSEPRAVAGRATPSNKAPQSRDYDRVTLAELVAAANGGASRPIRLEGAAIGRLRVSGRFSVDDTEVLAERLARLFGLRTETGPAGDILLRAP